MKKAFLFGTLILAVAAACPAMAFEQGTVRLGTGTGILSSGTGFSTRTIDPDAGGDLDIDVLAFDLGYFVTDRVEVALRYAATSIDSADFDSAGLAGKYYFPLGDNSIYAGGGFETLDFEGADGDAIFATGGFNYMFRPYFSIDFYLLLGQGDIEGEDFDLTDIGVTYSIYFR